MASGDVGAADPRAAYELWVTCGDCGDVVVPAERCMLRRDTLLGRFTLAFPCPGCARRSAAPLDAPAVMRLLSLGFDVQRGRTPAELRERRPAGAPFTPDDLLAFHELLAGTDDVGAALGG
jgi:hypothetical protein